MEISKKDLIQRYSILDDDSLIKLYIQDTLTPIAKEVLVNELLNRDVSLDVNSLKAQQPDVLPSSPTAKETAGIVVKGVIKLIIIILVLVAINFSLFGFGAYIAPAIWTTSIDKACQKDGYWYGSQTDNPDEVMCSKWWAAGGRRGSH